MYTRPASGIEGSLLRADPSPAYGSESSTGGGRLVRALAAMETARHPFPVSSTTPHYRRRKSECQEPFAPSHYSRKKVVTVAAVISACAQTAPLETSVRSRTGTNHSGRVFRRVLFRRERLAFRVSRWFLTDSPSGVYCSARKQLCSFRFSFRMTASCFCS